MDPGWKCGLVTVTLNEPLVLGAPEPPTALPVPPSFASVTSRAHSDPSSLAPVSVA